MQASDRKKIEEYVRVLEEKIDKIEEEKHDYDYNSEIRVRLEVQVSTLMATRNDVCRMFDIKPRLIGECKCIECGSGVNEPYVHENEEKRYCKHCLLELLEKKEFIKSYVEIVYYTKEGVRLGSNEDVTNLMEEIEKLGLGKKVK